MADVFLSYSKTHRALTSALASDLQAAGYSVWWDTSLIPGDDFADVILHQLGGAQAAIVLWTPGSVKSRWVRSEARRADTAGKLIPVRSADLNESDIPPPYDTLHTTLVEDRDAIIAALRKMGVTPSVGANIQRHEPIHRSADETAETKELVHWEFIKGSSDPKDFLAFLERFPNGAASHLADAKITQLETRAWVAAKATEERERISAFLAEFPGSKVEKEAEELLTELEKGGSGPGARMKIEWSHAGIIRLVVGAVAVAMGLYHMWAIAFGSPEAIPYRGTHLLFALTLTFLIYRWNGAQGPPQLVDYALLALGAAPILYLFINYSYINNRIFYVDDLYPSDIVMAVMLTAVIIEATRRVIGWALPITALIFLAYGLLFAHVEPMRFLDQLYMTTEGIFGIPLAVSASYVLIFVLFGSFMERTGTGQLFMDFAMALTGHTAGGPGKVSVFSSSLFGTISGSAVANVMVDGPIAIPLMKRTGFRPHFAAGVESVASTGGQIMPPIMGAAAFVMAEFQSVSYLQVTIWAAIPALLYYVACFSAVHFEAKRAGIHGVPRSELPKMGAVLRARGHLFIPVLSILVVLYSGYSAPMAALVGTLACFPVAALRSTTRQYVRLGTIIEAMIDGARNALAVALACACAGIIIAVITISGLGINFTQFVVGLAQNTLFLALALTMVAGIVLGMGMPTTPAYIIMTALLVPAIVKLGVVTPAAHMFAFYFAILSAITPPVALAVYAAAGLAKADLWKSGLAAVKIGAAGFIVPFMFVYEPALLMVDPELYGKTKDLVTADWTRIVWASGTAVTGCVLLAAGLQGYLVGKCSPWQRAALVAAALCLIEPRFWTDITGATLTGLVVVTQLAQRRRLVEMAPKPGE